MLLNLTKLGDTKKSEDASVLLTKNKIKAIRRVIFKVVKKSFGVKSLPEPITGSQVDLSSVVTWIIREQRLHKMDTENMELNIKLDGRPFWGKDQVMIGIVPIGSPNLPEQSAKSVYPLAIANCKEDRNNIRCLLKDLNRQKAILKNHGLCVDGKFYKFKFTVTLDYKALLLLAVKKDDENFKLAGTGLDVEFCIFCTAIRKCRCPNSDSHETCVTCFQESKGNIGNWKGIRDDLDFLLEEELSEVNLCALHCEMRNTEWVIGSVGLMSYHCNALKELNAKLSELGPGNFKDSYVKIKEKKKQETCINRSNIKVSSMSGPTERKFLGNIEDIVRAGLPFSKVKDYYSDREMAESFLLNKLSFCVEAQKYFYDMLSDGSFERDYGTHQTKVTLNRSDALGQHIAAQESFWQQKEQLIDDVLTECDGNPLKDDRLSTFAAEIHIELMTLMAKQWKEIALVLRDRHFDENEDSEIDIFDVQCKHWGLVLRHIFGVTLGTGDYGHLTIEHAPMLMRRFRSLNRYSNQGFEAAHKLQRQLYSRATNHDCLIPASSLEDILVHSYCERLLSVRYAFREAKEAITSGRSFYYRGCGWKKKNVQWTEEDKKWIHKINDLLDMMLGSDHLMYGQTEDTKYCVVKPQSMPSYEYNHQNWEDQFSLEEQEELPAKPCETPEPAKKIPKLSTTPPAKRSLKMKQGTSMQRSTVVRRFIQLPTSTPIRVPRVPGWGGTFGNVTLTNTCPIDNLLTIVYLRLKDVPKTSEKLSTLSDPWAKDLTTVERLFDQHEFTQAKVEWLRPLPQFDFSVTRGTIDVWGNEFDLFWQRCESMLKTAARSTCSSQQCPRKEELISTNGIHLTEISTQGLAESYIEAAIREWQLPAPRQCGKEFAQPPPSTADAILGPPRLNLSSGQMYQPFVCNGVRTFTQRKFFPEMPFALPISLHHFATNGLITEPHQLPDTIILQNKQYELGGCTFWNGQHYSGCFRFQSQWFHYDGLPESRSRGSGVLATSLKAMRSRGYVLSSCVYFEVYTKKGEALIILIPISYSSTRLS
ncbi:uncharacterized protein LOC144666603 [Oculina patagonica]